MRGEVVWAVRVGGGSQFGCDVRNGGRAAVGFVRETDDIVDGYLAVFCQKWHERREENIRLRRGQQ